MSEAIPYLAKAIYPYSSPHDDDLDFTEGQLIQVVDVVDDDWLQGTYKDAQGSDHTGMFPKSFIEKHQEPVASKEHVTPPMPVHEESQSTTIDKTTALKSERLDVTPGSTSDKLEKTEPATDTGSGRADERLPAPVQAAAPIEDRSAMQVEASGGSKAANLPVKSSSTPMKKADAESKPVRSNAFKDRIAAFNNAQAMPIAPKPLTKPTLAKKPFMTVASKPASKESTQPGSRTLPSTEPPANQTQVTPPIDATTNTAVDTPVQAPKIGSLKDRIAALQAEQNLHKHRGESTSAAPQPSEPTDAPSHVEMKLEDSGETPFDNALARQPSKGSMPDEELIESPAESMPRTDRQHDTESTEAPAAMTSPTEPKAPSRTLTAPENTGNDEVDAEEQRKEQLRQRMAKMSGMGMGMHMALGMKSSPPAPRREAISKVVDDAPITQHNDIATRMNETPNTSNELIPDVPPGIERKIKAQEKLDHSSGEDQPETTAADSPPLDSHSERASEIGEEIGEVQDTDSISSEEDTATFQPQNDSSNTTAQLPSERPALARPPPPPIPSSRPPVPQAPFVVLESDAPLPVTNDGAEASEQPLTGESSSPSSIEGSEADSYPVASPPRPGVNILSSPIAPASIVPPSRPDLSTLELPSPTEGPPHRAIPTVPTIPDRAALRPPPPIPHLAPPPPAIPAVIAADSMSSPEDNESAQMSPVDENSAPSSPTTTRASYDQQDSGRPSMSVQRTQSARSRSIDLRRDLSSEYLAKDISLDGGNSTWWTNTKAIPPSLSGRDDVAYETDENEIPHRGGRKTITKEIYVLYADYSQTLVSASYETNDVQNVTLRQEHQPPPVRPTSDLLETEHRRYGQSLLKSAAALSGTSVGDGSAIQFVKQLLSAFPDALPPVGARSFGFPVYNNIGNASVSSHDEIRAGDIVTFRNAKFTGTKGAMKSKYNIEVGKPNHCKTKVCIPRC